LRLSPQKPPDFQADRFGDFTAPMLEIVGSACMNINEFKTI
jgi:hypothetical protein